MTIVEPTVRIQLITVKEETCKICRSDPSNPSVQPRRIEKQQVADAKFKMCLVFLPGYPVDQPVSPKMPRKRLVPFERRLYMQ